MLALITHRPADKSLSSAHGQQGFTLVEMTIVIAVLGILAAFAAPNIDNMLKKQRNKQTTETVIAAFREARTESLLRRQDVVVVPSGSELQLRLNRDNGEVLRRYSLHAKAPITLSPSGNITFRQNKTVSFSGSANSVVVSTFCDSDKKTVGIKVTLDNNGNILPNSKESVC